VSRICVVLAGGEGRRMGGGKPLRRFGRGTLIERALQLAHGYAPQVAVAVRDRAQLPGLGARLIFDDPTLGGPLAGLAAALVHARACEAELALTLPCDTPYLPADLAQRLAVALAAAPTAGAAVPASGGRRHPACTLWRVSTVDRLPAYLETGARSLRGFAEACAAVVVEWPAAPADPFANANTPEDLAALQPEVAGAWSAS
jgi:molybdopterin-guanine dinucleotide biosynthesis protein A